MVVYRDLVEALKLMHVSIVDLRSWTIKTTPPSFSVTEKMAPHVFSASSSVIQGEGWFYFLQAKIVRP